MAEDALPSEDDAIRSDNPHIRVPPVGGEYIFPTQHYQWRDFIPGVSNIKTTSGVISDLDEWAFAMYAVHFKYYAFTYWMPVAGSVIVALLLAKMPFLLPFLFSRLSGLGAVCTSVAGLMGSH